MDWLAGVFPGYLGTVAYLGADIVEGRKMRPVAQDGSPATKERPPVPVDPGPAQERGA
jgi:hypothetical protein